ncbi:hypothetical protein [Planococcus sp. Urea-trap-24]|uniref:hypothetical protein n=1 Tax=Planococcus sp. Urea-trap-24 TaxID=2058329 RepID=UPI000C7E805A|nr:hypothetical protein [Planococcus sp. Urea-trap-24]PKG46098.1 hypothetical protein CXF66_08790 [Planococcus sp. Urea-trap-24]
MEDEKKEMAKPLHLDFLRDTTIIIGLTTIMGYLVAYKYQSGFRTHYYLDDIFMNDITVTSIIISIASILAVAVGVFNLSPIVQTVIMLDKSNENKIISRYIFKYWILLPLLLWMVLQTYLNLGRTTLIMLGSLYFLFIILPIIISSFSGGIGNYRNNFKSEIMKEKTPFIEVMRFMFFESTKGFIIILFVTFILLGSFASLIGMANASKKDEYLVFKDNGEDYIVIAEYDKRLIVAPFNKGKNTIISSYQLIEINSTIENQLEFQATKFQDPPKVERSDHIHP